MIKLTIALLGIPLIGFSQISAPLDVMAKAPVLSADLSKALPGLNPYNQVHGFSSEPGAMVQIIEVGANGHPDIPAADGTPGGDDSLFGLTHIGAGIAPGESRSGRFAASFYPPPPQGTVVYARIFDRADPAVAQFWTQSGTFEVNGSEVMDITELGAMATMQPTGATAEEDSDGDGHSNNAELLANTNPLDARDHFKAQAGNGGLQKIRFQGEAGRRYCLERCLDSLAAGAGWEEVAQTPVLVDSAVTELTDPSPPQARTIYYRLRVEFP